MKKGNGKREDIVVTRDQKNKRIGKGKPECLHTILLLVREPTTQKGPYLGLNSSTSHVARGQ